MCGHCNEELGIRYVSNLPTAHMHIPTPHHHTSTDRLLLLSQLEADSGENSFKVGTYLIEKPKVMMVAMPEQRRASVDTVSNVTCIDRGISVHFGVLFLCALC